MTRVHSARRWRPGIQSERPIETTMPFWSTRNPANGRPTQAAALRQHGTNTASTTPSATATRQVCEPPEGAGSTPLALLSGAGAGGVIAGLAVSPEGGGALAWVALVPLLVAIARRPRGATLLACIVYAIVGGAIGILPWLVPAGAAYFATGYWRAAAWVVPS